MKEKEDSSRSLMEVDNNMERYEKHCKRKVKKVKRQSLIKLYNIRKATGQ